MSHSPPRFTLRDLPLPAKLVLSAFLISVGLGYLSAMVQLHLKHSDKDGNPLPTPDAVIERFSGLKRFDPNAPPEKCKISLLLGGDVNAPDVSKDNMAPAFKAKSKGYDKECAARGKPAVDAERDGEWNAMIRWLAADPAARKASYDADSFPMPADWKGKPFTKEFAAADLSAVKVKSLIDARCQNCHEHQAPDLGNYGALEPLVTVPSPELIDGKWVRSSKQITTEALTQSTHAHLLSFSVLFTLTGLVFAFSGFPGWVRGVVGPVVLIAQVADISCWWLARVPTYGPIFAQTIMVTGGVVGMGLSLQIVGGLFSMYGWKGKGVLTLIVILGLTILVTVMVKVIEPALEEQKKAAEAAKLVVPPETAKTPPAKTTDVKTPGPTPPQPQDKPMSQLEKLLVTKEGPWNGKGTMRAAFFEKDGADFKKELPARGDALVKEREGELTAVVAWGRLDDADRRKAFDADALPMPTELGGKPITPDFVSDDKATVKVKTLLAERCGRCHSEDGAQSDFPLEEYAHFTKYLAVGGSGKPAAGGGEAKAGPSAEPSAPPIPKAD